MIGHETRVPAVADPLGGSYYVERLTDQVESEAERVLAEIDELGGAVAVIESGWMQRRIAESAYRFQRRIESGDRVVVGVNRFVTDHPDQAEIFQVSEQNQHEALAALERLRAERDGAAVRGALDRLETAARGTENLMPYLRAALAAYATVGECARSLRGQFGEYQPPDIS